MMNQKFVNGANDGVVKKAKAMARHDRIEPLTILPAKDLVVYQV